MNQEELKTLQEKIQKSIEPCSDNDPLLLELISFSDGVMEVKLRGSCRNCPAAQETFDEVIRDKILHSDERIVEVVLNRQIDPEIIKLAREILRKS